MNRIVMVFCAILGLTVFSVAECGADCEVPAPVILAFEAAETLHPDPTYLAMFEDHLSQIEAAYPFFSTICPHYSARLGQILVQFTDEALALWEAGEFRGLDELNERFGVSVGPLSFSRLKLYFDPLLHPRVVAAAYREVEGVKNAIANAIGTFDCEPTDVTFVAPATYKYYLLDNRDCFSRRWTIEITPDGPVVVSGWPIPTPIHSPSWGALKSRFN